MRRRDGEKLDPLDEVESLWRDWILPLYDRLNRLEDWLVDFGLLRQDGGLPKDPKDRAIPQPLGLRPGLRLEDVKKLYVLRELRRTRGNVTEASASLGMGRRVLYDMLKRWGLISGRLSYRTKKGLPTKYQLLQNGMPADVWQELSKDMEQYLQEAAQGDNDGVESEEKAVDKPSSDDD